MIGEVPESHYCRYYTQQCGHGLPHYKGPVFQRGHGIGNMLRGAFRTVGSIIGPTVKKEGKRIFKGVLGDVLRGRNLKTSIKNRALQGLQSGAHKLMDSAFDGAATVGIKRRAHTRKSRQSKVREKVG